MPQLLIERLNIERHRHFIGRQSECERFKTAIHATELPFSVFYLFGAGGVGKTMLLREWMRICKSSQLPYTYLDARTLNCSPESFLHSLRSAMQLPVTDAPISKPVAQLNRYVLLIDSYETLAPLDDWLREIFLPQLSTHILVVLAGRCPPASTWRADPGWQSLLHPIALQNLAPEESQHYLTQRNIPIAQHATMLSFTQGHPLALSLVADAWAQGQDNIAQLEATSEVVKSLLEKFLDEVPSSIHRKALEACAMVRRLTETLLVELLDRPDVHELFEWLRGLSFIQVGSSGLFPQDLARDILITDLRWRNPSWYATLHQRIQTYYSTRLEPVPKHELNPVSIWQEHLMQRETVPFFLRTDSPRLTEFPLTFTQPEFFSAVLEALRYFARPDLLYNTPLLRSRLVLEQSANQDSAIRIKVLQDWIQKATESLQFSPRDAKLYRALYRTYLFPAATQEQAAEALDLPFSTYRRHLKAGVTRVAGILWQWEIQGDVAKTS